MDRLIKIILHNKYLFKYIINIGRTYGLKCYLYHQIKDVEWILKNGYEGLFWDKMKCNVVLKWDLKHSRGLVETSGELVIKEASSKLFEEIFYSHVDNRLIKVVNANQSIRDLIFHPHMNHSLLEYAIKVNNNGAAILLMENFGDSYPTVEDAHKYLSICLNNVNPEMAVYIMNLFSIKDSNAFKLEGLVINKAIHIERYKQLLNLLIDKNFTMASLNSSLVILLIINGDKDLITKIIKNTISHDKYAKRIIGQVLLVIYKVLRGKLLIPVITALERIKHVLSVYMNGSYSKVSLKNIETRVSRFTKLTNEECAIVTLYELMCWMSLDNCIYCKNVKVYPTIAKVNDCENIDTNYLTHVAKSSDYLKRIYISHSTSLPRLKYLGYRDTIIENASHFKYFTHLKGSCLDLPIICSAWYKNNLEMMSYLCRNYLDKLILLKDEPSFWNSYKIRNLDHLEYCHVEKLVPTNKISSDCYDNGHQRVFNSLEHFKKFSILVGSVEKCCYTPCQNSDLEIVEYILKNSSKPFLIESIDRIQSCAILLRLTPIIRFILDKYITIITNDKNQLATIYLKYFEDAIEDPITGQVILQSAYDCHGIDMFENMIQFTSDESIINIIKSCKLIFK